MAKVLGKGDKLGGWDSKKYLILSTLNHGSYGTVYAARNARTLNKVAIKQISRDTQNTELEILTRLRKASSRNIIKLIDSFSNDQSSYIVNDFCTLGDLYEVIAADRVPIDSETIRDLILQLIQSVEACHHVGVYHRDIKPENIFLTVEEAKSTTAGDGEVVLKLGDFGLATCDSFSTEIGTGSDRYMAPEQFSLTEAGGYYPAQADIWSLGIVIMNTLFSRNPWKVPTEDDPVFKDFLRDPESLFEHFSYLTRDTFKVLKHALRIQPEMRSLEGMKAAVLEVLEWTQATDSVETAMVSRRASTNLADYDTMGPTAGRAPLRTPSIMHTAKLQSTVIGSFPWSKALAGMDEEKSRNGLGFAKPALRHPTMLSSSWRKPTQKELGSLDSGLGASLTSFSPNKYAIPRCPAMQAGSRQIAKSAPGLRIKFPEPSPNKGHLKFGTSWADQDSDSENEILSPVWSNRRKSAIQEENEEGGENSSETDRRSSEEEAPSSFDEVAFFDFDDAPVVKSATSTKR